MKKSIIAVIITAIILVVGAIIENDFVSRQFLELHTEISAVYDKTENQSATENDVYALQNSWLDKKKYLHIFIPHNEIKEIDLWLSESIVLVKDKSWTDALSKFEVLKELSEQIPKTFSISIENIF